MKAILHMNLFAQWFDMVDSEIKLEEYRLAETWNKRIPMDSKMQCSIKIKGKIYKPEDVLICFSNGYRKDRRQVYCEITYLKFNKGHRFRQEWGADPDKWYFAFGLKKIGKPTINNETV